METKNIWKDSIEFKYRYSFYQALDICPEGYRLPTIDELCELSKIVNYDSDRCAFVVSFDDGFFMELQSNWYWSSTEYGSGDAWNWDFYGNDKYWYTKTYDGYVRCVRIS